MTETEKQWYAINDKINLAIKPIADQRTELYTQIARLSDQIANIHIEAKTEFQALKPKLFTEGKTHYLTQEELFEFDPNLKAQSEFNRNLVLLKLHNDLDVYNTNILWNYIDELVGITHLSETHIDEIRDWLRAENRYTS